MYPILVWYINKMVTDRGGRVVDGVTLDDYEHDICLWFKSPPGCKLF